jgi:hypothetical protein
MKASLSRESIKHVIKVNSHLLKLLKKMHFS